MEINKVSDYLIIYIYHERYMFSTEVNFYGDESLQTVVEDNGYKIEGIKMRKSGYYISDSTHRRPINDYEYEIDRVKGVEHIEPEVLLIIDLNEVHLDKNDFYEFVWGQTNTKYGLLDIIKEDK